MTPAEDSGGAFGTGRRNEVDEDVAAGWIGGDGGAASEGKLDIVLGESDAWTVLPDCADPIGVIGLPKDGGVCIS
jgi:hypothetical protein